MPPKKRTTTIVNVVAPKPPKRPVTSKNIRTTAASTSNNCNNVDDQPFTHFRSNALFANKYDVSVVEQPPNRLRTVNLSKMQKKMVFALYGKAAYPIKEIHSWCQNPQNPHDPLVDVTYAEYRCKISRSNLMMEASLANIPYAESNTPLLEDIVAKQMTDRDVYKELIKTRDMNAKNDKDRVGIYFCPICFFQSRYTTVKRHMQGSQKQNDFRNKCYDRMQASMEQHGKTMPIDRESALALKPRICAFDSDSEEETEPEIHALVIDDAQSENTATMNEQTTTADGAFMMDEETEIESGAEGV